MVRVAQRFPIHILGTHRRFTFMFPGAGRLWFGRHRGSGGTYTDEAALALGVAEHLAHRAVLQGVNTLAGKLVSVGGVQRRAGCGQQEHIGEQEEHLGLDLSTLGGHGPQPAFADVPPAWKGGGCAHLMTSMQVTVKDGQTKQLPAQSPATAIFNPALRHLTHHKLTK